MHRLLPPNPPSQPTVIVPCHEPARQGQIHRRRESVLFFFLGAAFVSLFLASPCAWSADPATWKAVCGRTCITPAAPVPLSGYAGRAQAPQEKLTDLWAKALLLEAADGTRVVLVTLDLIGLDRATAEAIRSRLRETQDWNDQSLVLATSHTHTGPAVGRNLAPMLYDVLEAPQQEAIDRYSEQLVNQVTELVQRVAAQPPRPVRLQWGHGSATFAVNRRNNRESDVPDLRSANQLAGPVDHDVPVLAVRDSNDQLMAVVFGYACHATVLSSRQLSGDYPAFAQLELEARYPDCVAMFVAGCGGDQNPLPRRSTALAQHYGKRLATAVDSVLMTTTMTSVSPTVTTAARELPLPFDQLPTEDTLRHDAESQDRYRAARAKQLLKQLTKGPMSPTYPYPITLWRLGNELDLIFLGGEVVVDYALEIKRELGAYSTWVAAYCNDVMAYIPSRRVLQEGGYEGGGAMVYYGLPTLWAPEVESMIIDSVQQLARPEVSTSRSD
ncbi:MAG: neutral/alkaline non-lysosomal ceramidase N-terminal domain-containing protein [Planctomycetales bacterium]|nr:neutral/alkaline non-lysosomal ceramidase N-terminal domain-containing protein [Planctomycetales bacterium]